MLSRSEGIKLQLHHSAGALSEPRLATGPQGTVAAHDPVPFIRDGQPRWRSSTGERLAGLALITLAVLVPGLLDASVRHIALAAVPAILIGAGLLIALFFPSIGNLLAPARRRPWRIKDAVPGNLNSYLDSHLDGTAVRGGRREGGSANAGADSAVGHLRAVPAQARTRAADLAIRGARVLGDAGAVLLAIAIASSLTETPAISQTHLMVFVSVTAAGWLVAFGALGLYDPRKLVGGAEELKLSFQGAATGTVLTVLSAFLLAVPTQRSWVLVTCAAALGTVIATRLSYRRVLRALRLSGRLATRLLIVGGGREARDLWRTITGKGAYLGFEVVGLVDDAPAQAAWPGSPPVLGPTRDIRALTLANGVEAILVAGGSVPTDTTEQVYRDLQGLPVDLHLSTGLLGVATSRVEIQRFVDIPVLGLRRVELTGPQQVIKRAVDVVTAGLALLALGPVMLACAIAIRLSGPGPILFRQRRVGQDGEEFVLHKFRSMVVDAEQRLGSLAERNESDGLLFKMADDPRVTRVGKFMRKWSLDELPQLFDVLRGDMSIVGPRPPLPSEVAQYDEWLRNRLRVKPGITGLWQVSGRHSLSFEDYVRYDLYYVNNWSLALDLFISLRTIPAVLARSGV
jgi:exopolysaccharide biosynthesis polyprenyl glycosylphosphotransferase